MKKPFPKPVEKKGAFFPIRPKKEKKELYFTTVLKKDIYA